MSFAKFLQESRESVNLEYTDVDTNQLSTLRQEINKIDIIQHIKSEYLDNQNTQTKIVDDDFYVDGVAVNSSNNVVLKGAFVAEVTEDDGYVYFKKVEFVYTIEDDELNSIVDVDRLRSDDWKVIQSDILKTGSKI